MDGLMNEPTGYRLCDPWTKHLTEYEVSVESRSNDYKKTQNNFRDAQYDHKEMKNDCRSH